MIANFFKRKDSDAEVIYIKKLHINAHRVTSIKSNKYLIKILL